MSADLHTFLFADLVGYTVVTDREGDDRALEVALGLQRHVRELLFEHDAEQVKAIGDGLMLRFADAEAAIRLAIALLDRISEEAGFPAVRIGINTGPALMNGGDWYGRAVNVAARLCEVAHAGEVLLSESTRIAAGSLDDVGYDRQRLRRLHNVSKPVPTYRAWSAGARSREPAHRCAFRRAMSSFGATA